MNMMMIIIIYILLLLLLFIDGQNEECLVNETESYNLYHYLNIKVLRSPTDALIY